MSWQAVAAAKSMRVGSVTRKAVLLIVAEYAHDDGSGCWASISTIAADAECNRHTAGKALNDLETIGAITRRRDGTRSAITVNLAYRADGSESATDGMENATAPQMAAGTESATRGSESATPPDPPMAARVPPMAVSVPCDGSESATNHYRTGYEPPVAIAPDPKPRRRATAAPDTFEVTPELRAWAETNSLTIDLEAQTEMFLDHHRAKGTTFKDWTAGWRKWMRNAQNWQRPPTSTDRATRPGVQRTLDRMARLRAEAQ